MGDFPSPASTRHKLWKVYGEDTHQKPWFDHVLSIHQIHQFSSTVLQPSNPMRITAGKKRFSPHASNRPLPRPSQLRRSLSWNCFALPSSGSIYREISKGHVCWLGVATVELGMIFAELLGQGCLFLLDRLPVLLNYIFQSVHCDLMFQNPTYHGWLSPPCFTLRSADYC